MTTQTCPVCGKSFRPEEVISGHGIRKEVEDLIRADVPDWSDASFICKKDYEKYRTKYVSQLVFDERGQIEKLESEVIKNIAESEIISSNLNTVYSERTTIGNRISDGVAQFGGSWKFIIIFFIVLGVWIAVNATALFIKPFDPYPFILMNLILSCIAAIQAPIIMMSQNRQEQKDRLRAENDYKINLKAEIEIRTLHEKVDHLLLEQWSKMMEIQQLQIDLLNEIQKKM
jgi:uncharacterized membrane protein